MVVRSPQSRAVLQAVQAADHPTADEVFLAVRAQHPKVSLGTVYRNLSRLVEAGAIRARDIGGQKRYDANLEPHVHIHDVHRDRLIDVPVPPALAAALEALAAEHGLDLEDAIVELRGALTPSTD